MVFAFPLVSYAQDGDQPAPVLIQGTPELENFVAAVRDAYVAANPDAVVEIDPAVGLRGAFEALCNGEVDIVMSTEPMTDAQVAACSRAGQNFIETVIAYEAVVLLPTPEAQLTCAPQDVLLNAWQLGASAEMTWVELGSPTLTSTVMFYGPEDLTPTYLLFRDLVPAGHLREDITKTDDVTNVLTKVQEAESGAFGFMSLADLSRLDPDGAVSPVAIENADFNCITPSLETLADGSYPLARTNYLYVNANSFTRAEVAAFLDFALLDEAGARAIASEQGYTAASPETYQASADNLLNGTMGRTFTRPVTPVSIPTTQPGTVTIVGTTALRDLTTPITNNFTTQFLSAEVTENLLGNTAGWQAFCSGEADVLQTTREATDEEKALCETNGITPYTLDYGYEALVVAVPTANDWIECLDAEQAAHLFRAGTDETPAVMTWHDLNADWPETDILLVLPVYKTGETDYLVLNLIGDMTFGFRQDAAVTDDDPLYRAQGVANTDNGITYLWWSDFQGSTADVKLLSIDAGAGCVTPSAETFADGTYALTYPVRYHFNTARFDNGLVRAFLWNFFDDNSLDTLADHPFAGLNLDTLRGDLRSAVFQMLTDYEMQAAEPATEPTAEPTPEATAEPTVEPTEEPTVEPTAEPTAEPTVEPTQSSN
jgi:phosphate transport system substrate-binding protein